MKGRRIAIYDTTLRDGAQGEGISFSSVGKIRVAKALDEFGVDYIEGGFAASNPKDMQFFHDIRKEKLTHAKVAAFGSTRRAGKTVSEDAGTRALLEADTPVCTIFGKSWRLHVKEVLHTTEEENLNMIRDTVRFLKEHGKEVIYDAEHFFDGYKDNAEYAMKCLVAAREGGADMIVPCDTNGGTMPDEIERITREVIRLVGPNVGMHTHNDGELAVVSRGNERQGGREHDVGDGGQIIRRAGGRQFAGGGARRRDACAGDDERLRRAHGQCQSCFDHSVSRAEDGMRLPEGRAVEAAARSLAVRG